MPVLVRLLFVWQRKKENENCVIELSSVTVDGRCSRYQFGSGKIVIDDVMIPDSMMHAEKETKETRKPMSWTVMIIRK